MSSPKIPPRPRRDLPRRRTAIRPLLEPLEQRLQLSVSPVTNATQITNGTDNQYLPSVARDAAGDYVVAWQQNLDVFGIEADIEAQVFNANGTAKTGIFTVNSTGPMANTTNFQPSVAMDANGDFVVAWGLEPANQPSGGGYYYDIEARRFSLAGTPQTSDIQVNSAQTSYPNQLIDPTVAMNNSSFVVGWSEGGASPSIDAQRYNFSGSTTTPFGSNFKVSSLAGVIDPSVGMDTAGDVVFAFYTTSSSGFFQVYAQVYNASDVAQGSALTVNSSANVSYPSLAMNGAGHFVIAAEVQSGATGATYHDVYAHQYALTGTESSLSVSSLSGNVALDPQGTTQDQVAPSAAIDSQGFAAVVWQAFSTTNLTTDLGIYARRINPDGSFIEPAAVAIAKSTGSQSLEMPRVAVDPGGDPVFVWTLDNTTGPGGQRDQIVDRLYQYVNNAPLINSIGNQKVAQNGSTTVPLSGITAGGNEEQTLSVTASSSNTSLIVPTVTYTSPNSTGTLNLAPIAGQFGTATITVTVTDSGGTANGGTNTTSVQFTLTVTGVPTANPQSVTVPFNTAKAITLTGSDPNGLTLTYNVTSSPSHGMLTGTAPNLTYTPNAGYHGSDSFTFTDSDSSATSSPATVSITVNPGTPTANPQSNNVGFNTAKAITLTGSDPDVPALSLTYNVATNPTHGMLSGTAPNLTYTPTAGYHGADSFTFTVYNGTNTSAPATVSLTVAVGTPTATPQTVNVPHNTATGITLTSTDPDVPVLSLTYNIATNPIHGTLSGSAPNLTYTPAAGSDGPDSFTFTVSNGTNISSPATVSLNVAAGTPTANPQSNNVGFNTAKAITLTGSDPDVPALSLTYNVATNPTHGMHSGTAPNLTYTPTAGYHGADSFTFTVNNGTNTSTAATVSLTVATGVPTANPQTQTVAENGSVNLTLIGTDPDVPALTLTYTIAVNPTHGSLSGFNPNTGAVVYTPTAGYFGPDTFQFTVNNGTNTSPSAVVSLSVTQSTTANVSGSVGITFGTSGIATLLTNADGLRLLPSGRNTDLPWLGINTLSITLSQAESLSSGDVTVTGVNVANYGPVTISGSGTSYTITLAQPISAADRVTVTIANANIATFTRRLDVLPGDVNDDGVVTVADALIVRNEYLGLGGATPTIFGDTDGNGVVDVNDYNLIRRLLGTRLP